MTNSNDRPNPDPALDDRLRKGFAGLAAVTPPPPAFPEPDPLRSDPQSAHDRRRLVMSLVAVAALAAIAATALLVVRHNNDGAESPSNVQVNSGPTRGGGRPQMGGSLALGVGNDFSQAIITELSLDGIGGLDPSDPIVGGLFDRLIDRSKDGTLVPSLATSWTSSADFGTWTIKLRNDVTFSDGTRFDGDVVVRHFNRLMKDDTYGSVLWEVEARSPDPLTVVFDLKYYDASFAAQLATGIGVIPSPEAVESEGKDFYLHPVGTGPFTLESADPIILRKNPNYWRQDEQGRRLPYLDRVVIQPFQSPGVGVGAVKSGVFDMAVTRGPLDWDIDPLNAIADAMSDDELQVSTAESAVEILLLNLRKPPFDDRRTRLLASMSIDRDLLSRRSYGGALPPALSLYPPDSPVRLDNQWPAYDGPAADRLAERLKSQGVSKTYDLTCQDIVSGHGLQGSIRAQPDLGANFRFRYLDSGEWVNQVLGNTHDWAAACYRLDLSGGFGDLFSMFRSDSNDNLTGYSNPEVDKALVAIRRTSDHAEQVRLLGIIQDHLAEDIAVIPLVFDRVIEVSSTKIGPTPSANLVGPVDLAHIYRRS